MVKFKEMDQRKASYCVKEGDEPQSDSGDHSGGRNQKRARRGELLYGHLSLFINLLIRSYIFSFRAVHNAIQKQKLQVDSPTKID